MSTIADLLAAGRLERIAPDATEARALVRYAHAHLESAGKIVGDDAAGAYQLAYDAARKAVAADMAANGYRAKSDRAGAHAAVVAYAAEALAGQAEADSLTRFERMRRLRNRSEYGGATPGRSQVATDLRHAENIVRAVAGRLGKMQP
jgi:hypothetical protein